MFDSFATHFIANRQADDRFVARHGGKLNVTFCDGHVEGFKYQKLYPENSQGILQKWNRDHRPHDDRLRNGRPN